jgi:hypothetical protein
MDKMVDDQSTSPNSPISQITASFPPGVPVGGDQRRGLTSKYAHVFMNNVKTVLM